MNHLGNSKGSIIRDRDIFLHDGQHLRRVRLSVGVQMVIAALVFAVIGWSSFATARLISAPTGASADMASLAAATELRARQIEQRQELLAAMLSGKDVGMLPETTKISSLPAELAGPLARADDAMAAQAIATAHIFDARYARTASALRERGINPRRMVAEGGPFEPLTGGDATFKQLFTSWKRLDNLADGAIAVPSDKPVKNAAFTSGYGVRSDPFKGRAAMHAGIDLAGPVGTPIYATADGAISDAGYNSGGYGNLVKIDHGRGIETRYGHLSVILVGVGQRVTRGQMIGRMGSTGRSTGSHLHYEVRIDSRAVNPIPFMKSSDYLLAMQRKSFGTHSMDAVALGGPTKR
ncbi:MAG: M23 family metallopeptidase [Pseudomonadota bacterium]|nr:M23 family metallopeptidase [Pseudomonadota bacterium]